jgi:hypothetical protein
MEFQSSEDEARKVKMEREVAENERNDIADKLATVLVPHYWPLAYMITIRLFHHFFYPRCSLPCPYLRSFAHFHLETLIFERMIIDWLIGWHGS